MTKTSATKKNSIVIKLDPIEQQQHQQKSMPAKIGDAWQDFMNLDLELIDDDDERTEV